LTGVGRQQADSSGSLPGTRQRSWGLSFCYANFWM